MYTTFLYIIKNLHDKLKRKISLRGKKCLSSKNEPSIQEHENSGLIPGQGTKIPHAEEQLRPCATATELAGSVAHATTREDPKCDN